MIDYLREFEISEEMFSVISNSINDDLKLNFEVMKDNVSEILHYLIELGVKNISNIILHRPDLCFKSKGTLEKQFKIIGKDLLIFIIDNDIDDLVNLSI